MATTGAEATELLSAPAEKVHRVLLFGPCSMTTGAQAHCARTRTPVFLLSSGGRLLGRVEPEGYADARVETQQLRKADDPAAATEVARVVVRAKIRNQVALLSRHLANPDRRPDRAADVRRLAQEALSAAAATADAHDVETVRGLEGTAARAYFEALALLVRPAELRFAGRSRRPPADPFNAVLSLGYTLLYHQQHAFARAHRLHPYVGFLHAVSPGHAALASDLVEEFRCVVDALALGLVNRRELRTEHFENVAGGGVWLNAEGRRVFFAAFEGVMRRPYLHRVHKKQYPYRLCLDLQARAMARWVRGEDRYRPFVWR
ncbi:MAG: CRISPR-associated endonuclease Cas1 [Bacteroidota bacterium]